MPSNMFITAAAAVLSISGMANALVGTAPYQVTNATAITATSFAGAAGTGAYNTPKGPVVTANATSSALGSAKPTGIFTPDLLFCPRLNNQVFTDIRGRSYVIECGRTRKGVQIDITVIAKRQTATTLNTCILTCSESAACVGTAFNRQTQQCSYFSSIGEPVNDGVSEFAYVTNVQPVTVAPATATNGAGAGANGLVPSVVYTVSPVTIYSCAPTVTNCPLRAGVASAVVTSTIPLYTTLCPYSGTATTTIPASAVACTSCPVSAGTATVYSQTVQQGTTTVVPVGTAPINFVNPSGSASSTGASATVTNPAGATKSVQAFTGAAGHVEAGMGMAAVMAMAVLAL